MSTIERKSRERICSNESMLDVPHLVRFFRRWNFVPNVAGFTNEFIFSCTSPVWRCCRDGKHKIAGRFPFTI